MMKKRKTRKKYYSEMIQYLRELGKTDDEILMEIIKRMTKEKRVA
jgi:hypothetical protein